MWQKTITDHFRWEMMCDVCAKPAEIRVCVGNTVVAEVCARHAATLTDIIQQELKTRPGPPTEQEDI